MSTFAKYVGGQSGGGGGSGDVIGPGSSVATAIALFADGSGTLLASGSVLLANASFQPPDETGGNGTTISLVGGTTSNSLYTGGDVVLQQGEDTAGGSGAIRLKNAVGTDALVIGPNSSDTEVKGNLLVYGQAYPDSITTSTPSGTTQTINWNNGNTQVLDLSSASGNVTVTMTNGKTGGVYTLFVVQGAGARNATFTALWPGGTAPTISTANGAVDIISFAVKVSTYYGTFSQSFS